MREGAPAGGGSRRLRAALALLALLAAACGSGDRPREPVWDLFSLVRNDPARPAGLVAERSAAWREVRVGVASSLPAATAHPITVPDGAQLDLGIAVDPGGAPLERVPPVRFRAVLTAAGAEHVVLDRVVDPAAQPEDRRWLPVRVDLARFAGRSGTLAFSADAARPGAPGSVRALFGAPRVLPRPGPDEPNVLLVTIDCLRADHVRAYGYARETTPALDRLAAEGVRFARAYTSAPMTQPSIAQIFTSRLFPAPRDATWLAAFHSAGVPTTAIVNNVFLSLWLVVRRDREGLDSFDRLSFEEHRDARAITDEAIAELDRRRGSRFVLYLHYLDAHSPYTLIPRQADRFGDPSYRGPITQAFIDEKTHGRPLTAADRQRVVDWYDAGIHWIDGNLGRLLAHLRADGRLDRTLVIVTADHGEELWDHGRFFHGQSLYDELLHVPLVVRLPGGAHAGTVVERPVRSLDIAPSILAWAGLPAPASFTGRSLAEVLARPEAPADVLFATATNALFPIRYAVRTPEAKLIETLSPAARELFDLAADPSEARDVLAAQPALAGRLAAQLAGERRALWQSGFQLRIAKNGGPYWLRLEGVGNFSTLDRAGPTEPRVRLVDEGRALDVRGRASAETLALRFDHHAASFDADPVRITTRGAPAEIQLGAGAPFAPGGSLNLLDPALEAAAEPPCPAPSAGVRICLWRTPEAGSMPAPDAATRERLRALGYTE